MINHSVKRFKERFNIKLNSELKRSILYRIQETTNGIGKGIRFKGNANFGRTKWVVRIKKKWITIIVSKGNHEITTAYLKD